jgi:hypothetical protein
MDKNALEQLLSSYNWWMGVSTIAVAVGILGEYVAHFVFEEDARRNKREMAVSILFGVLVLGGVVGEYVFGKRLTQVSEQLQLIADAEVAQSNKDAAQARKDAEIVKQQSAETNERAAKALKAAEVARKNAERFSLQIAQANERAANAEKGAADANVKYEEERKARLLIEQRMADREIKPDQREAMLRVLKGFKSESIAVESLVSEGREALQYAIKIADVFTAAGWNVTPPRGVGSSSKPMIGVGLVGNNDEQAARLGIEVAEVLIAGKLSSKPVPFGVNTGKAKGAVEIWVGSK